MSDKIRLLICKTCPSVQELPFYEGPPQYDEWLNRYVADHPQHIGQLAVVKQSDWQQLEVREAILSEIRDKFKLPGQGEGLGNTFYDLKSTFTDDAFQCWRGFNRTTDPAHCDYRKDSKRLLSPTRLDRKEAGLDPSARPNTYLCDFCPVHSLVLEKQRKKQGLYN